MVLVIGQVHAQQRQTDDVNDSRAGGVFSAKRARRKETVVARTNERSPRSGRVCVLCVFSSHLFWTSSSLDVPARVTQEEGRAGFLLYLTSAAHAFIFHARRIQPFLSLVDREVDFVY